MGTLFDSIRDGEPFDIETYLIRELRQYGVCQSVSYLPPDATEQEVYEELIRLDINREQRLQQKLKDLKANIKPIPTDEECEQEYNAIIQSIQSDKVALDKAKERAKDIKEQMAKYRELMLASDNDVLVTLAQGFTQFNKALEKYITTAEKRNADREARLETLRDYSVWHKLDVEEHNKHMKRLITEYEAQLKDWISYAETYKSNCAAIHAIAKEIKHE